MNGSIILSPEDAGMTWRTGGTALAIKLEFVLLDNPRRARITCDDPKMSVEHETMAGALEMAEAAIARALGGNVEVHIVAGTA
jgi:hypothetical protein